MKPALWESPAVAQQVDDILTALEVPTPIDPEVRRFFQRSLYRSEKYFGGGGREKIILVIRAILESEDNRDALIEPIGSAVWSCMRPEWTSLGLRWIEVFDELELNKILQTMRSLDLFDKNELSHYYALSIRRRLWKIFGPDVVPAAPKVKERPKPPRAVTRIPAVEKKIKLGLQLLTLRSKAEGNIEFGRLRRKLGVEPVSAQEAVRVARVYGQRPEIYRRLTWQALVEMASPSLSAEARADLEAKIMAGDRFSHTQIRARRPLRRGPPKKEPATRMAA